MKTKTFLLLCLFLGIGLTQLSAQSYKWEGNGWWECPVYCHGIQIDNIAGYGDAHVIDHYKAGEWVWEILTIKGVGWSTNDNEEFTFSEQDKIKWSPQLDRYTWTCHDNIKMAGEKGTLYNISLIINPYNGTYVVNKATCTGNTK